MICSCAAQHGSFPKDLGNLDRATTSKMRNSRDERRDHSRKIATCCKVKSCAKQKKQVQSRYLGRLGNCNARREEGTNEMRSDQSQVSMVGRQEEREK